MIQFNRSVLMAPVIIFVAAGLWVLPSAWAYVPASAYLVKTMATKHAAPRALRVRSTVTGIDSSAASTVSLKKTLIYLPTSRAVRFWITDDAGAIVYGKQIPIAQGSPLLSVLFDSRVDTLTERLRQVGVPIKTEAELLKIDTETERQRAEVLSLERYRAPGSTSVAIAWAIGAGEKSDAQLWLGKDTFLPLRLVVNRRGSGETIIEYVMSGARYARDFTMPKQIEYLQSGEKVAFREDVSDVSLDASAAELTQSIPDGFTSQNSLSSAARNLIQAHSEALK